MKNIFFAAITEENGKFYSFVVPVRTGENIKPILERYKNIPVLHLCESRKQADDLVTDWNEGYKANGKYIFDLDVGEKPEIHETDVDLRALYMDEVIKAAENLVDYFKYHNKNTTKAQDEKISDLEDALRLVRRKN